jgi:cytochrome c-type biogenesis protein CcmH
VRGLVFVLIWIFISAPISAGTLAEYQFDDPAKEEEFRAIIEEMRCLVCQNESLVGSNADLAVDLRNEIYGMIKDGHGKDDVIGFMVARYGDFVLYSPPVKPSTYPIWFGPIFLFAIGAFVLMRALKKKRQSLETTLTADEQERLNNLLNKPKDATK